MGQKCLSANDYRLLGGFVDHSTTVRARNYAPEVY